MHAYLVRISLIFCLLLSSACGFHLRGSVDVPEELRTVYVSGQNPGSAIVRNIKDSLRASGVTLTDKAADAPYTLFIKEEREEKRTISLNRVAAAAEFQIRRFVSYEIQDRLRRQLSGPHELINERNFQNDINNVVGKRDEERLIREEMQRALAQQIIRRYQSLDPEQLRARQSRQTGS